MNQISCSKTINYSALLVAIMVIPSLVLAPFAMVAEIKAEGQCVAPEEKEIAQSVYQEREISSCDVNACTYEEEARSLMSSKKGNKKTAKSTWAPIISVDADPLETAKVLYHGVHAMTAYTSEVAQTDASPCTTATGFNVCNHGIEDTIAANFLPFGTKVQIPDLFGDRVFVVRDRMNRRHSSRVDVWMKNKQDAMQFGIRKTRILVLK